MSTKRKLYAYIDESGQNTKGRFFVVSILVLEEERELIQEKLRLVENVSKKNLKWNKSRHKFRLEYLNEIVKLRCLKNKIFFEIFHGSKEYIKLTSHSSAKAILKRVRDEYKVTIFIDGFRKKEIEVFQRELRDFGIKRRKIRGVKKEENNIFIRLVDSICGLISDVNENKQWAKDILNKLRKRKIVTKL